MSYLIVEHAPKSRLAAFSGHRVSINTFWMGQIKLISSFVTSWLGMRQNTPFSIKLTYRMHTYIASDIHTYQSSTSPRQIYCSRLRSPFSSYTRSEHQPRGTGNYVGRSCARCGARPAGEWLRTTHPAGGRSASHPIGRIGKRGTYHNLMLSIIEIGGISCEHRLVARDSRHRTPYSPWEDARAFEALVWVQHSRCPLPNSAVRAAPAVLLATSGRAECIPSAHGTQSSAENTHGSGCQFLKPIFAPSS